MRAAPIDGLEQALLAQTLHSVVWHPEQVTPRQIDRYTILRRLGAGGMGVVYAAYDQQLDRKVALKLVRPERASDHDAQERLLREARAMARLSHRNIVQIYEVGRLDADIYLAMEFIDGQTLDAWLAERPRSLAQILGVFLQAGEALAAAHDVGLVHRDFKPSNVLVCDQRIVVIDFGLARAAAAPMLVEPSPSLADGLETTGMFAGTPAYMSPEQFQARPPDARSDQFSFCVTLYEALAGARPFNCASPPQILAWISGSVPPRAVARIPVTLRATLLRGLRVAPAGRWPAMRTLLGRLQRVVANPRPIARLIAGLMVVAVLIVVAGVVWQALEGRAEANRAEQAAAQRRTTTLQVLRELDAQLPGTRDVGAAVLRDPSLDTSMPDYRHMQAQLHENLLPQATVFVGDEPEDAWFLDDGRVALLTGTYLRLWSTDTGAFAGEDHDSGFYPDFAMSGVRSASGRRLAVVSRMQQPILKEIADDVISTRDIKVDVSSVAVPSAADTHIVLDWDGNVDRTEDRQKHRLTEAPLIAGFPLTLSDGGDILVTTQPAGHMVYWDLRDATPRPHRVPDSDGATPRRISQDQRHLFASGERGGVLWRLDPGGATRIHTITRSFGAAAAFSGTCLITADHQGDVAQVCDCSRTRPSSAATRRLSPSPTPRATSRSGPTGVTISCRLRRSAMSARSC